MTDPSLTITIDRSGMPGSLDPLVFSGSADSNELGVEDYQPPALQSRLTGPSDSAWVDGSEVTSVAWQQAILGWSYFLDDAATETEVEAAYDEVAAAIGQFRFLVTTQTSSAAEKVWTANRGSIVLAGGSRSYMSLVHKNPVYAIALTVQPIPGA